MTPIPVHAPHSSAAPPGSQASIGCLFPKFGLTSQHPHPQGRSADSQTHLYFPNSHTSSVPFPPPGTSNRQRQRLFKVHSKFTSSIKIPLSSSQE